MDTLAQEIIQALLTTWQYRSYDLEGNLMTEVAFTNYGINARIELLGWVDNQLVEEKLFSSIEEVEAYFS